ncbi:MAG: HAD family hydrolase [Planctomycetes bacterium]|nr:HAD family hydrolase [Planctomycetota bacterium]MBM4083636.1 HAD family hydrolase [Planctomycetota bacterium]
MADAQAKLKEFKPKHKFFVGIDSDGCAFDTMEIKHKECFIPNIINHWDLQPVSKYAREAAEFVNLYSKWRGINRFPALTMVFDLLTDRKEVQARKAKIPAAPSLRNWIRTESKLGEPALLQAIEKTKDPELQRTYKWSRAVNDTIADMVHGVPPFPLVRESLVKLSKTADIICVSATPGEALVREWEEHDIAQYTAVIAGQEMGSKTDHLRLTTVGKYEKDHVLMVGDADGDLKAARANNALFFPVNPGHEEASWEFFYNEAIDVFLSGKYAGDYEAKLIKEFMKYLPEVPPWKR